MKSLKILVAAGFILALCVQKIDAQAITLIAKLHTHSRHLDRRRSGLHRALSSRAS